jgi:hypothetical protein
MSRAKAKQGTTTVAVLHVVEISVSVHDLVDYTTSAWNYITIGAVREREGEGGRESKSYED